MSASQVYEFRRFNVSSNPALVIMRPLSLDQIVPAQTTTINVSNTQLKALNTTYLEVIPAPGVGNFIEVLSYELQITGADAVDGTTTDQMIQTVRSWMALSLLYDYSENVDYPLHSSSGEIALAARYNFGDSHLFESATTLDAGYIAGGQPLANNKALMLGATVSIARSARDFAYDPTEWDHFWTGIDDKQMSFKVDYYVR